VAVIDDRTVVQLRLALSRGAGAREIAGLLAQAQRCGLTGAEIDAALSGSSFDVQTAAAVALALALRDKDREAAERARARADHLGLAPAVLDMVEAISSASDRP
jgi:hypothetical protein